MAISDPVAALPQVRAGTIKATARYAGRQFIEFEAQKIDVAVSHIVKTDRGLGAVITPAPSAPHR
jgi:hypothetical protein